MKKITRGDFWMLDADEAWDHVNTLQTELDRLERVGSNRKAITAEEIVKILCDKSDDWCKLQGWEQKEIARHIQPLTAQQGFVPDWSKAPKDSEGNLPDSVAMFWYWNIGGIKAPFYSAITTIPRPAPKTRERTREEKIKELDFRGSLEIKRFGSEPDTGVRIHGIDSRKLSDSTIDDLCRAAGIDLKVTEE